MNVKIKILIYFLLISFLVLNLFSENIKFRHLDNNDGLTHNSVYSFFQDSKGFIWIGTMDGLNRYDGYSFKTYKYSPYDKDSINGGWIVAINEDNKGNIWVGTRGGGLGKIDITTGKIAKYYYSKDDKNSISSNTIPSIIKDDKDIMWFGTSKGLNKYDVNKNLFLHYFFNNNDPYSNLIFSVSKYKNVLWLGTGNGLIEFDTDTKNYKNYRIEGNIKESDKNYIREIQRVNEYLWLATKSGLIKFDIENKKYSEFLFTKNDEFRGDFINDVVNEKNNIWFSVSGKGIYKLNKQSEQIINFQHNINDIQSLKTNKVLEMFIDNSGLVWVGTWAKGLNTFHPNNNFIHYYYQGCNANSIKNEEVFSLCKDKSGNIYIGLFYGEVNKYNPKTGKFSILYKSSTKNILTENIVTSLTVDNDNNLWIGHGETGIVKYNLKNDTIFNYIYDKNNKNSLSSNAIKKIFVDDDIVWIGTVNGLNKFHNNKFEKYFKDKENKSSLIHNNIRDIIRVDKNLWIITGLGISIIDKNSDKFINKNIKVNKKLIYPNKGFYRSGKFVWFITSYGGLIKYNKINENIIDYSSKNGFPTNNIYSILNDDDNNLWMGSDIGLIKFNINSEKVKLYKKNDGISDNRFLGSAVKTDDGKLYFGTYNGITALNPKNIKENKFTPPITLTSITIYPKKRIIENGFKKLKKLYLTYHDTTIHFKFASLDFRNPKKNKYKYKLKPIHKKWISLVNKNELSITNLSPGNYTLFIKGTNSDGIWNENKIELDIIISPPFWQSWWFRSFLFVIFIIFILFWHKTRLKRQEIALRSKAHIEQFCIKNKITEREIEIIKLVLDGKTNKEMEDILFITAGTVKNHIYNIFKKLNVKNRTQLAGLLSDWKKISS